MLHELNPDDGDGHYELTPEEEDIYFECSRLMLAEFHERSMRRLADESCNLHTATARDTETFAVRR